MRCGSDTTLHRLLLITAPQYEYNTRRKPGFFFGIGYMAHEVRDFQKAAVRGIEAFDGRALLAAQPGLGKTLISLHYLRRNPSALPAVVVCPASMKSHWVHQAWSETGKRAILLDGVVPTDVKRIDDGIYVINYDILLRRLDKRAWIKSWVDRLTNFRPGCVIFDECQNLINRERNRTKAARSLSRASRHVLGLSGTPLTNRPAELWPVLNMIRPDLFPSFWSYGQEYCDPRKRRWGWEFKGATNLDQLHLILLRQLMIRILKKDVASELGHKVREVIRLPLSDPTEYRKAETDFLGWLMQTDASRIERAKSAERLTQMGYLLRLAAKLKLRATVEWLNNWLEETDEKIVVFAVHRKMIEALSRRLNTGTVIINGDTPPERRRPIVQQFEHDRTVRAALINIQAGGTGLDGLQNASSTVAVVELDWRPGVHIQAEDRLHRMGQGSSVSVHYLISENTIETDLCRAIQKKQRTISQVLDGRVNEDDLSIYDQVLERMRGRG